MPAKQIKVCYKDKEYILEYTRKSVQIMERRGFIAEDISRKPASTLPELFAGAFVAHHPLLKRETVDAIFDSLPNKDKLIEVLADMYNEPILSMLEGSAENEGNASWTAI